MRVSKETTTKVAQADTLLGEVIESGDRAIVKLYGAATHNKSPLQIDSADWAAFAAAVKAVDRYVPNGATPVHKPRRPSKQLAAQMGEAAPATTVHDLLMKRKRSFAVVTLENGMRVRLGRAAYRVLTKIAHQPDAWHNPRSLGLGAVADVCWTMTKAGLLDRSLPLGSGVGKRAQYRISAKGQEALEAAAR